MPTALWWVRRDLRLNDNQALAEAQAQAERDQIFSLLAYAVVLKDWQTGGPNQRGHNISSVLVDPQGKVVFWARNWNQPSKDGAQHGEVRAERVEYGWKMKDMEGLALDAAGDLWMSSSGSRKSSGESASRRNPL